MWLKGGQGTILDAVSCPLPCLRQSSNFTTELAGLRTFVGVSCLYLPSSHRDAGTTHISHWLQLLNGFRDLNSSCQACMINTFACCAIPQPPKRNMLHTAHSHPIFLQSPTSTNLFPFYIHLSVLSKQMESYSSQGKLWTLQPPTPIPCMAGNMGLCH